MTDDARLGDPLLSSTLPGDLVLDDMPLVPDASG